MELTAMVILERCRRAEAEKRRLREKIDMYRESAGHMTASLDGIGSRSTGDTDRMAAYVARIDAAERALRQRDREHTAEVAAACRLLELLPDLECGIMNRFYVRGQSLNAIAQALHYSYSHVAHRKLEAVKMLREVPEAEVIMLLPAWYVYGE